MQEGRQDENGINVQGHSQSPEQHPSMATLSTHTPGWLTHVPDLHPDQFPQAPMSFVYNTALPSFESSTAKSLSSSSSFNHYLQNHLPTYSLPASLEPQDAHGTSGLQTAQASSYRDISSTSRSVPPPPTLSSLKNDSMRSGMQSNHLLPSELSISHVQGLPGFESSSWSSNYSQVQLPPVPQDVEYQQDVSHAMDALDPRLREPANNASVAHAVTFEDTIGRMANERSATRSEHDTIDRYTALQDSGRASKRTITESLLYDDETQTNSHPPKPKKMKKGRSLDVQYSAPFEETPANKPRKEPRGRGRPKGQKVGLRPVLDPGPKFMNLYNQAMDAFIEDNDVPRAQTKVLEAIGVNPEIYAAHSLLADIHFANGDHEKALDALIGGLHAHMNDVELWRQVADTILTDRHEAPQIRIERAMYCFGGILRKDSKDMDARFQRAECARLLGQVSRAFSDLNVLLQDDPHNSTVLAQFTKLCYDVDDAPKAKLLYEEHFEYYRTNGISETDTFTWQDIGMYVDLVSQTGEIAQAIVILKRLSRWLCGRRDEAFWEEFLEDDREFDQNHYPRRLEIDQFVPNRYPERDYGDALPLDIRAKLGILRLKLNYRDEAESHFDWLEPDLDGEESLVEEYSDTFLEVAKALHEALEHEEALRFYDALDVSGIELGFEFWIGLGTSAYVCEQREKAIRAYLQAMDVNPQSIEARTQLAKLYRDLGDRSNALRYGREAVVMSQDAIPQTGNRKYESKENRLLREAAERALKGAYRLPRKPDGMPGKVPDSLKYRTRMKSRFIRYVPRNTEEPQSEFEDGVPVRTAKGRPKKFGPPKKSGRQKKANKDNQPTDEILADTAQDSSAATPTHDREDSASPASQEFPEAPETSNADGDLTEIPTNGQKRKKGLRTYRKVPSKIDPRKHYEDIQTLYQTLLKYQHAMRLGDMEATSQWVDCAQAMVDDFRAVKVFFPGERHKKFEGYTNLVSAYRPPPEVEFTSDQISPPEGSTRNSPATAPPTAAMPGSPKPIRSSDEEIPSQYCDIPFAVWLDIFLELALLTATSAPMFWSHSRDVQAECYSIVNAAIDCNVFYHHPPSLTQIYTVYLCCCLVLNDDVTLYNTVLRWFMNEFAFCTDTYRLYSVVALIGEYTNVEGKSRVEGTMYRDSSNQKYLFRQLCSIDQQLPRDYGVGTTHGPVPAFMRRERDGLRRQMGAHDNEKALPSEIPSMQRPSARVSNENTPPTRNDSRLSRSLPVPLGSIARRDRLDGQDGIKTFAPKEMDVVLFVLYAHLMMANNSFTNALNYLYRAHSLDPSNTVVLLSMTLCYLTELFKRQVGNRHAFSLMGWVWFGRYEKERRKWAEKIDEENQRLNDGKGNEDKERKDFKVLDLVDREIEFNRARCWDMLGMADLASRGYKRMLKLPSTKKGQEKAKSVDEGAEGLGNEDDVNDYDDGPETFDMEAAYALSRIYAINGDSQKAKEIAEQYMVVE